ncbi:hypothetical protein [Wolbachia endosymbiont (group A) of Brachyopa scutellaris]|uniref:hypothetical protein n=1 Tax=Wolbachia endosymbiont (group A) of Brachyopa scutellaris TaxID=3066140 RepID=UPI003132C965
MKAHSSLSFQRVTLSNDVIPVLDTGSFMTTVPRGVIPVPRDWDPGILLSW